MTEAYGRQYQGGPSIPVLARKLELACLRQVTRVEESAASAMGLAELATRPCDAKALFVARDLHARGRTMALLVSMNVVAAGVAAWWEQDQAERTQKAASREMDELRRQKAS